MTVPYSSRHLLLARARQYGYLAAIHLDCRPSPASACHRRVYVTVNFIVDTFTDCSTQDQGGVM